MVDGRPDGLLEPHAASPAGTLTKRTSQPTSFRRIRPPNTPEAYRRCQLGVPREGGRHQPSWTADTQPKNVHPKKQNVSGRHAPSGPERNPQSSALPKLRCGPLWSDDVIPHGARFNAERTCTHPTLRRANPNLLTVPRNVPFLVRTRQPWAPRRVMAHHTACIFSRTSRIAASVRDSDWNAIPTRVPPCFPGMRYRILPMICRVMEAPAGV